MASIDELSKAFYILIGAGLDYAPTGDQIAIRAEAWKELLADVPGDLLILGSKDIALAGEKFPSVKRVRDAAFQVKAHNGQSAAPNQFAPLAEQRIIWEPAGIKDRAVFPPDVQSKIDRIIERIGDGVMPDATLEYIDKLTAPYREVQHEPV